MDQEMREKSLSVGNLDRIQQKVQVLSKGF